MLNTLLPACQAPLPESDQAAITAAWSFIRSFGSIWGVAIPAAVFNNRFSQLVVNISDPQARSIFGAGDAYQFASSSFLQSFAPDVREQVVRVYSESLKRVWQISIVFAGVAFLLVFLEKQIKLRTELETEFGLEEKKAEQMEDAEGSVGKDHQSCKTVIESDVQNSA